eukprot:scaffold1793_cov173-Amphora_coffeaeformis.AAC.17
MVTGTSVVTSFLCSLFTVVAPHILRMGSSGRKGHTERSLKAQAADRFPVLNVKNVPPVFIVIVWNTFWGAVGLGMIDFFPNNDVEAVREGKHSNLYPLP